MFHCFRRKTDDTKGVLTSNTSNVTLSDWNYLNKPGFRLQPLRIAICGAGVAGLCLAYKIIEAQKKGVLGPIKFVLFEKDDTAHGTQTVILVVDAMFQVLPTSTRLHPTQTGQTIYNNALGTWDITVVNLGTSEAETKSYDVFAPATGVLSNVNHPAIPGLESFTKTRIFHTAEWPVDLDWQSAFKDERVAVIGIGSSSLQTIGAIAPHCKNLDIYGRSKFWVVPTLFTLNSLQGHEWHNENFLYTKEEQADFIKSPETLYRHLKEVSASINGYFALPLGPTPGAAFLEALKLPTVDFTNKPIKMVTTNGIMTDDGIERLMDRIILATGFDTGFKPSYKFIGGDGVDLSDVWAQRPKAYMSIAVTGFPNMFLMGCGPGITYVNGSLLPCTEAQADYIVACLSKLQKQDIKTMEVNKDAQDEYNIQREALMKDLIFTEPCPSWYKGGKVDGEPDALYAGSTLHYMEMLASPRWEDWKFVSIHPNRISYLGNGASSIEATGGDRAYYITIQDARNALKASDYRAD
ncbi:uncharacterized protein EV420DRAFT_1733274 [Desarmillaria tabescens]|uniref:FAD/NAD(P)-binding domain-containing protein n=1 Tax=Armillaria tabescens TaxID=1929756 RepID=A0AA39JCD1_ARMTA|nr:uncharacterized protein EV420DRAFT_1733274 [Desarmillaria tabescens]KAK0440003.1 hypothetical protein EV420DRAFT_1733274 [Desarmillaria tabescens]